MDDDATLEDGGRCVDETQPTEPSDRTEVLERSAPDDARRPWRYVLMAVAAIAVGCAVGATIALSDEDATRPVAPQRIEPATGPATTPPTAAVTSPPVTQPIDEDGDEDAGDDDGHGNDDRDDKRPSKPSGKAKKG